MEKEKKVKDVDFADSAVPASARKTKDSHILSPHLSRTPLLSVPPPAWHMSSRDHLHTRKISSDVPASSRFPDDPYPLLLKV